MNGNIVACLGHVQSVGDSFNAGLSVVPRDSIDQHINKNERELVVTTIVPCDARRPPRQLSSFNIINLQRRLKYALEKARIPDALGGIDFSFNEDREGKYQPVWSVHFHLITSRESKKAFGKNLREWFLKSD